MPTAITKHEFRAPADILDKEIQRMRIEKPVAELVVANAPLVGTWMNCDHQTRGLVRVMIAPNGNEVTIHAFGACSPDPCDWGAVNGLVYATNVASTPAIAFTSTYVFGFKQTILTGHLLDGALFVESFDHFTDHSGRADYYALNIMSK